MPRAEIAVDDVTMPMLLRTARHTYAAAMRDELIANGLADLPRNGPSVLVAMRDGSPPLSQIARDLAVSKQAASKLIDLLVVRGFLARTVDSIDRRRISLTLTERGHDAAAAVEAGTDRVDAALADAVSATQLAGFRAGLRALVGLSEQYAIPGDEFADENEMRRATSRR